MATVPVITIFVRHGKGCTYTGETTEQVKCKCKKHLRYIHPITNEFTREATGARDWAGAKRVMQEKLEEFKTMLSPQDEKPDDITIEEAVKQHMVALRGRNVTAGHANKIELVPTRLQKYCEKESVVLLRQISLPVLTAYRGTWATDSPYKSPATRGKAQSYIRGFLDHGIACGWLKFNPGKGLRPISRKNSVTLPLEPEEYTKLLQTIQDHPLIDRAPMHAHAQLMRYSGLALKDATQLPRAALQKSNRGIWRVITKRSKTEHHENAQVVYVPIPTTVAEELLALKSPDKAYFFLDTNSLANHNSQVVYYGNQYRDLFKKAGLMRAEQRMVSHRLRDTFAVELLNAGVPLEDVSKMLGHSSIKTTEKHYAAWVKRRQDRADDLVVATFKQEPPQASA